LANCQYPMDSYYCDFRPVFPYPYSDVFLCGATSDFITSDVLMNDGGMKFTNDTSKQVPVVCSRLLEKGPDFRAPPVLNNTFIDKVELELDKLTYKLRWQNCFPDNRPTNDKSLKIPFERNTVRFPKHLEKDGENKLNAFKYEVLDKVKIEVEFTKKSKAYREVQNQIKETKKYLNKEKLTVVPTDKSKRLCVTEEETFRDCTGKLLEDEKTYKPRKSSKSVQIEQQANKIVRSCFKNILNKRDLERLLVSGTEPANFKSFIKDHKPKTNGDFPMRPIASVRNTPTEKIDFICSRILNQLLEFVPAHLNSSDEIINEISKLNNLDNSEIFISLDVISLYPSVPLDLALTVVNNFARKYWPTIDSLGLTCEDFEKCLKFVTYNYEITFNNKVYLQVGGVPMGTHYAPPFAVIFMDFIETTALTALQEKKIRPDLYKRYIDDIVMGPFPKDENVCEVILNAFNAVTDSINFTMEIPKKSLNFLDLTIWIEDQAVQYKHYSKEISSGNCLNKSSWVPNHIKTNFVMNSLNTAERRCNTASEKIIAVDKAKEKLKKNGYSDKDMCHTYKNENKRRNRVKKRTCNLKMPFVSDSLNRKINSLVRKYDLNVNVVNSSSKKLKDVLNAKKNRNKHEKCDVCDSLPNEFNCGVSNVVYEFVCKKCDSNYIGKTCRSFRARYLEHKRSIRNSDDKSALSVHVRECECNDIGDFDVNILDCVKSSLDIALLEARWIRRKRPMLNRCDELSQW